MPNQFISDIITEEEIAKWKLGDRILITSQTGSGKSQWVKDILYEYCVQNNKKILLLSNRVALKGQNEKELSGVKEEVIKIKNYQTLESSVLYGNQLDDLFSNFDYIVLDEIHYLLSDSAFNGNTDILLNCVKFPQKNKIFIFITATPQAILLYNKNYEHKYALEQDYSFIEKVYFYNKDEMVNAIITNIPSSEKILYFGNALDSLTFSLDIPDSSFICSDNNREFKKRSSRSTMDEVVETNEFSNRALFSTKVLDNGVNIISPNLKHIIIDMSDPVDLIQCLGRKRIAPDEKIFLYIKNQNRRDIYSRLQMARKRLAIWREFNDLKKDKFQKKYAREQIDNVIMNDGEINWAKVFHAKYLDYIYSKIIQPKDGSGYRKIVCGVLGIDIKTTLFAEEYFEKKNLTDILESYVDRRLYKNEQEEFRNMFFENIFSIRKNINIRHRGVKSIGSIMEEDNLPFTIDSRQAMERGEFRGKTYWTLKKI